MSPASPGRRIAERPKREYRGRLVAGTFLGLFVLGGTALGLAVVQVGPGWLGGLGSSAVATSMSWLLAARSGNRAMVAALVAVALCVVVLVVDTAMLRTGAAVLTAAVAGVLGVMATVPAVRLLESVREVLVAVAIATVGAFAALGFEPVVTVTRFEYTSIVLSFALVLVLVHRLGAGLHGLGRRGLVVVVLGTVVLLATMAYAELLRRYGIASIVEPVIDVVRWSRANLGAFPRPLVVLLGVPALVWGCHMRARRRQGWWVCAFGVAATTPVAQTLVNPGGSYLEAGLQVLYGLLLGLLLGIAVVRVDLAVTGPKGRGSRRAEEAAAHRPEPRRFAEL